MKLFLSVLFLLINYLGFSQRGLNTGTKGNRIEQLPCNNWLKTPSLPSRVNIGQLNVTGDKITVEATINRTAPYSGGPLYAGDIVSKHSGPNDANYLLRPNEAEITTSNGYFRTPDICDIELNKTYHVAMVYDGSSLKFYRNGFLMSQVAASGNLYQNTWNTTIGLYELQLINTNFIGYINEVRIWNTARTQSQLRTYMNTSLPVPATQAGLLAYYTFDDLVNKQGNIMYNGSLEGSATINETNPACNFIADSCAPNDCNTWLNTPSQPSYASVGDLDIPGNKITVEANINRTSFYSNGVLTDGDIISKHTDPSNANYILRPTSALITTSNGFFYTPDVCPIKLNKTYHVAMVYDGASLKFYRDGFLLSQVAATGNLFQNDFLTTIGFLGAQSLNENFVGYINEVRIWNIARTQAQIRSYMNTSLPSPTTQTGLLAYYKFNDLLNKQGNATWNATLGGSASINQTNPNCEFIADSCEVPATASIIINNYTPVISLDPCLNKITVEDAGKYNPGDTVLLIQMKGAVVDSSNTSSFGNITNYKNAGNYEINYVKQKTGNVIELKNSLTRQYDVPFGKVQLVRVPYYKSYMVNNTLTCPPWDGKKGGVLVLIAKDTINMAANIDVSAKGFDGGHSANPHTTILYCNYNEYYYPANTAGAADKGESISEITSDFAWGKGDLANGGGGGNGHNSGGGGGSNGGVGGFGGYQLDACTNIDNRGIGGEKLNYSTAINKIFLGGGGGAGHTDNPGGNDMDGESGGGIAIIKANVINGGGFSINAKGGDIINCNLSPLINCHDGNGGGGGGGTVLIESTKYSSPTKVNISGGKGGDLVYYDAGIASKIGPGGGGGGGTVWVSNAALPANLSVTKTGGINGVIIPVNNDPYGTTPGQDGINVFNLKILADTVLFKKNIDSVRIKDSAVSCTSFNFKGLGYTNISSIKNWEWKFGDGATASTQNTLHTYTTTGSYTVKLIGTDINGCKDSITKQVSILNSTPDFYYTQEVCNPLSVQFFSNNSLGKVPQWNFGDGISIAADSPIYIFKKSGNYRVSLKLQNACGDSVVKNISINFLKDDIILTQDTTICFGSTKKLQSVKSLNFCWSPTTYLSDPSSPNPVTSAPQKITYYLTAQIEGDNMIANGNFNNGNTSFTSEYSYSSNNTIEGEYFVGSNPENWNASLSSCRDHTTGSGKMLLVNGSPAPNLNVWKQSVTVTPNTNYAFSTWVQALWPPNPAQLKFSINGVDIGNLITASLPTCTWTQFFTTWNSGSNTTAIISIVNKNIEVQGNDFALDDISFAPVFVKRDSVIINVNKPLIKSNKDTTVCEGSQVQLNTSGGISYVWTPTTGLSNPKVANPLAIINATTNYIVAGTNASGCTAKDTVVITVNSGPTINISKDTAVCGTTPVQLLATGGIKYTWSPAATLNKTNINNPVASPANTTFYHLTVTNIAGCSKSDSVKITVNSLPVISKSNDTTICNNSSAQLFANGGTSYLWSPSISLSRANIANPVASPTSTTSYHVTVKNSAGCAKTDSIKITTKASPIISKTNDTSVCKNLSVQLFATGGISYSWTSASSLNNPNVANPVATPVSTTIYYVTVKNSAGCSGIDSVKISSKSLPTITASQDVAVCDNTPVQLSANGGTSYLWTPVSSLNNPNINNPVATPSKTTTYYVKATNSAGCSNIDSIKISTSPPPVISKSKEQSICTKTSAQLFVSGGTTYTWSPASTLNNSTINNPIATPTSSTTYIVDVSNSPGCSKKDSIKISIYPKPFITTSNDTTICNNSGIRLFANGGVSYQWTPASTLSNPNISNPIATPLATTVYQVIIKDANACSYPDSVKLTIKPPPVFTVSADQSVCTKDSKQLAASGGNSYTWQPAGVLNNSTLQNPIARPVSTTTFTVKIKESTCHDSALLSTTLTVLPLPKLNATKSNDINCSTISSQLNVSGAIQYTWTPAGDLDNNTISGPLATPKTNTLFTVKGTDNNGCSGTDTISVKVSLNADLFYLMPNSFTPNGDNLNDCYGLKYWGTVDQLNFSIYNRFGERVFYTSDASVCWDGKYKGKPQNPDAFVYIIHAKTACGIIDKKGYFVLVR